MGQKYQLKDGTVVEAQPDGSYVEVQGGVQLKPADPMKPLNVRSKMIDVQKGQADLQLTPYQLRKQKAEAQSAEIDATTKQEAYDAAHPKGTGATVLGLDALKTMPLPDQEIVKALGEGRLAFPAGFALKAPWWQQKLEQVAQVYPDFDATNYNNRAKARAMLLTGKVGTSANALNTMIGHAGLLNDQISGTASHNNTGVNAIENWVDQHLLGQSGITNYKDTAGKLASEETSVYRNGGGAEADVSRYLNSFDPNAAEKQKRDVVRNTLDLAASKQAANLYQYNLGSGGKPPVDLLDPAAKAVLDKFPDIRDKYFAPAASPLTAQAAALLKANGGMPPPPPPSGPRQLTPEQKAQFFDILQNQGADKADAYLNQFGLGMKDRSQANRPYSKDLVLADGSYANSYAGQGLSGVNEGIANTLGAPVDLATAALNLVPKGINAVANTNIPTINDPVAGGDWWKRRLSDIGSILPSSADTSKQFVRRVGQSVGATAIPVMGAGGSLAKGAAGLISGLGGGIGAATAQQMAPGNPLAEMGGELVGGGLTGFGLVKAAQRAAQRGIEAGVPTVSDLRDQAAELYRRAETRGVTATPDQTNQLAATIQQTLKDEGQLGPAGKITNADTNTSKAFNLIQQYAGQEMKPTEMGAVRKVLSDSRQSSDPTDRRLGSMLLGNFDDWVSPLAPEFDQARSVASRYLQTQDLEQARNLAGANASQFTGSGFENALRTQYRGLDRNNIKGNNYFNPDVTDAIQTVARGTPTSNLLRGIGRLAPTGPVSGMGSVIPALGVASMTNPATGGAVGSILAGGGFLGRVGATRMGINAADNAELIARNGGALPQADLLPRSIKDYMAFLAASQAAKYQGGSPNQ